jgi:hypothetical protein
VYYGILTSSDMNRISLIIRFVVASLSCLFLLSACEKEIKVELPAQTNSLVVEASVNNLLPTLNYVFITQTIDYFDPKIEAIGLGGAEVYITEGTIVGNDTVYDLRYQMFDKLLPESPDGIYLNPLLFGQSEKVYKLEIYYQGKTVKGVTQIPVRTNIDTVTVRFDGERDGKRKAFPTLTFFDPPEPSYYRMAYSINKNPILLGFGASDGIRLLNDDLINNKTREYNRFQPLSEGDTLNNYLCRIGRKEYLFWQSFGEANNNNGPFATPVQLRSTLSGAIGCFTGYAIDFNQRILR